MIFVVVVGVGGVAAGSLLFPLNLSEEEKEKEKPW